MSTDAYKVQKSVWELMELEIPDMVLGTGFLFSAKAVPAFNYRAISPPPVQWLLTQFFKPCERKRIFIFSLFGV